MSVSDNFNRADGGLGANWSTSNGTWGVSSNQCLFTTSGSAGAAAFWTGNTFNNDQSSQLLSTTANLYVGVAARVSGVAQAFLNGYIYFNNGSCQKYVGGVLTSLGSGFSGINIGETATITVTGTSIALLLDGSAPGGGPFTDSSLTSGSPGILNYDNGSNLTIDDWVGTGEITSGITPDQEVGIFDQQRGGQMVGTVWQ